MEVFALSPDELWFPLLDYVNDKRHVNKKIGKIHGAKHSDPGQVKEIANVLWNNTSDIDEYLRLHNFGRRLL